MEFYDVVLMQGRIYESRRRNTEESASVIQTIKTFSDMLRNPPIGQDLLISPTSGGPEFTVALGLPQYAGVQEGRIPGSFFCVSRREEPPFLINLVLCTRKSNDAEKIADQLALWLILGASLSHSLQPGDPRTSQGKFAPTEEMAVTATQIWEHRPAVVTARLPVEIDDETLEYAFDFTTYFGAALLSYTGRKVKSKM